MGKHNGPSTQVDCMVQLNNYHPVVLFGRYKNPRWLRFGMEMKTGGKSKRVSLLGHRWQDLQSQRCSAGWRFSRNSGICIQIWGKEMLWRGPEIVEGAHLMSVIFVERYQCDKGKTEEQLFLGWLRTSDMIRLCQHQQPHRGYHRRAAAHKLHCKDEFSV